MIQKPSRQTAGWHRYGKSLRDAVDFYELHLKSQDSLRQIKLEPFVKEFLKAKEEGKTRKKRRNAKLRYLGTLRYRLGLLRGYLPEYGLGGLICGKSDPLGQDRILERDKGKALAGRRGA